MEFLITLVQDTPGLWDKFLDEHWYGIPEAYDFSVVFYGGRLYDHSAIICLCDSLWQLITWVYLILNVHWLKPWLNRVLHV